jgi:hypothetical protein
VETTDIGLASFIYSLGKEVEILRIDPKHCIFRFTCCPEIKEWQSGQAMVNGVIFINSYRTLIKGVKNGIKKPN